MPISIDQVAGTEAFRAQLEASFRQSIPSRARELTGAIRDTSAKAVRPVAGSVRDILSGNPSRTTLGRLGSLAGSISTGLAVGSAVTSLENLTGIAALPTSIPRLLTGDGGIFDPYRRLREPLQGLAEGDPVVENSRSGPGFEYTGSANGEIDFTGGQSPGVVYLFTTTFVTNGNPTNIVNNWSAIGPISKSFESENPGRNEVRIFDGNGNEVIGGGAPDTTTVDLIITNMRRADGQPDTGGNPPNPDALVPAIQPIALTATAQGTPPQPTLLPSIETASSLSSEGSPTLLPVVDNPRFAPAESVDNNPENPLSAIPQLAPLGLLGIVPAIDIGIQAASGGNRGGAKPPNITKAQPPCNSCSNGIKDLINRNNNQVLNAVNSAQLGAVLAKLNQMQSFAEKAWQNTHAQKLINLLTLITTMHNAAMISRDIGETMGYVTSQALAVVGITDENGQELDINGLVGSSVENFVKSIVGEEAYATTVNFWQKSNRVIQAASNIVWTIRNIQDTTQDVLEWTAENTGKIGNALIKYGVVGERAYPYMAERMRSQDRWRLKYRRVFQGLESVEESASSIAQVTSNVREIQIESGELGQLYQDFKTEVSTFGPQDLPEVSPENLPVQSAVAASKAVSESPDVAIADAEKGSG